MRECFCFGSEAVNASGEAVRGLVKSRKFLAGFAREKYGGLARSRIPPATQAIHNVVFVNCTMEGCKDIYSQTLKCSYLNIEPASRSKTTTNGFNIQKSFH